MIMTELPTQKIEATIKNARKLLIYSPPKTGKTELLCSLENNLVIDLEKGTDMFDSLKIKVESMDELYRYKASIEKSDHKYDYITIDTVTKLEEMANDLAIYLYKQTPMGKNYTGKNILTLANGAGYFWIRLAFKKVVADFETLPTKCLILSAHLKDKFIDKGGEAVSARDIDLQGKLKSIICADVDAIGYLYRKEPNKNYLTFISQEEVICGARPPHLSNKEFLISEKTEEGLKTYWDKIFI